MTEFSTRPLLAGAASPVQDGSIYSSGGANRARLAVVHHGSLAFGPDLLADEQVDMKSSTRRVRARWAEKQQRGSRGGRLWDTWRWLPTLLLSLAVLLWKTPARRRTIGPAVGNWLCVQ